MFLRRCIFVVVWLGCSGLTIDPARAEDPNLPTFRSFAGAFLAGQDHDYFVESELRLPLLRTQPVSVFYHYRESTPFLGLDSPQAELLYRRQEAEADFRVAEQLRFIAVGGYHSAYLSDRAGRLNGYVLGGGVGSPLPIDGERVNWRVIAGSYVSRVDLDSDWWMDAHLTWRVVDFAKDRYLDSHYRASLVLGADMESSNDGGNFRPLLRIGPEFQFFTANRNRASVQLQWYYNDDNPLAGSNENGLLLGLNIHSSLDHEYVFDARQERQSGLLPLIWGAYDVGVGHERTTSRFEMNVELIDVVIREHLFTGFIWYESRQEYRVGDFDNIAYSVSLGVQTPVGLASALSRGEPLVFGADFLHRSDHALNPDAERVQRVGLPTDAGTLIVNGSHNLLPRIRLQTTGWDLPYRDPSVYDRKTEWLNMFNWRITAGLSVNSNRHRGSFAGQLGVNWDIATVEGYVVYLRGIASAGNETPDWLGEIGVRRPAFRIFTRFEDYGINANIARDEAIVAGVGVTL
jgi:hypothetical protein